MTDSTMVSLKAGAAYSMRRGANDSGWHSMDSAPRDGTYVELKCSYGVAPWYCIARWTDECTAIDQHGERHASKSKRPSWQKPQGGGPFDEGSLQWRPYNGTVGSYIDPTGGLQSDPAYWRGAVAAKYGLPLNHFEALAARNERKNKRKSFWSRLFG